MDFFRVTLNDDEWTVYITDEVNITSLVDDGSSPAAFIEFDKREMYFDKDHLSLGVVRHEMTHVAISYLCLDDANFDSNQLEEVMADFMCKRLDWFLEKSNYIYNELLKLKEDK